MKLPQNVWREGEGEDEMIVVEIVFTDTAAPNNCTALPAVQLFGTAVYSTVQSTVLTTTKWAAHNTENYGH